MGVLRRPGKVKLIAGLLTGDKDLFEKARKSLEKVFGKTDFESDTIDFTHTSYYEDELGINLKRRFLGFVRLFNPENIYKSKVKTNRLERKFSKNGNRQVNIDPGYLDMSKVVLFSTKDYSHRVYLRNGIFAEVTLFYKDGKFNPWPWTYPDYKSASYIEIFNSMRNLYKENLEEQI